MKSRKLDKEVHTKMVVVTIIFVLNLLMQTYMDSYKTNNPNKTCSLFKFTTHTLNVLKYLKLALSNN